VTKCHFEENEPHHQMWR